MALFEIVELTRTEVDIVRERLAHPTVLKYLKGLAQNSAVDLAVAYERSLSESPAQYMQKNAFIHGTIEALNQLVLEAEQHPQPQQRSN